MSNLSRTELDAALNHIRSLPSGAGREVARALGISNSTVNGWISGGTSPTGPRAVALVEWHRAASQRSYETGQPSGQLSDLSGEYARGVIFAAQAMSATVASLLAGLQVQERRPLRAAESVVPYLAAKDVDEDNRVADAVDAARARQAAQPKQRRRG